MRFLLFILPAVFVLGACSTKPSPIGPALKALKGQNIRTAIQYLGYPDETQEIVGDSVYTWSSRGTYTDVYPIIDRDTGRFEVDGKRGTIDTTTRTYVSEVNSYSCKIKMATGKDDVIKSTQAVSSGGGCQSFDPAFGQFLSDFGISLEPETLEKGSGSL